VRPESHSGDQSLACEAGYGFHEQNLRFEIRSGQRVRYSFGDGIAQQVYMYGATRPNHDEWTHLAVTRDGAEAVMYFNGVKDASESYGFVPKACPDNLTVGGTASGANSFKGRIDDVRLYDHALSGEEIADLGNGG